MLTYGIAEDSKIIIDWGKTVTVVYWYVFNNQLIGEEEGRKKSLDLPISLV